MIDNLKQCYEILGLATDATSEQAKQAYRDLVKVWHPDRFGGDPRLQLKAQDKLREINEAYERLTSPLDNFAASPVDVSAAEGESEDHATDNRVKDSTTPPKPKAAAARPFSDSEQFSISINNFAVWSAFCTLIGLLLIVCIQSTGASRSVAATWIIACSIISIVISKLLSGRNKRKASALPAAFTGAALGSCFGSLLFDYHSSQLILDIIGGEHLTSVGFGVLFEQLFLTVVFLIIFLSIFKLSSKTRKANYWWLASSLCGLLAIATLTERALLPSSQAEIAKSLLLQPKETATPKNELRESENASRRKDNADPFVSIDAQSKSSNQRKTVGRKRSASTPQEQGNAVMQWPPQKTGQSGKEGLFIYNEPQTDN